MIHGHARIKLYNPISGHVIKEVEKENTFVGLNIANYIKDMGTSRNGYYPEWSKTVGGILLFRDTIQGTPQFMPKTNRMVANGAYGIANTAPPTELGSYNENESIIGGDSITQVYDWNMSQGNGLISCVSLTSQDGGFCGYGNLSGGQNVSRSFGQNTSPAAYYSHGFLYGNYIFRPSLDGNTLTVERIWATVNEYNIFQNLASESDEFDLTEVGTIPNFALQATNVGAGVYNMFAYGENGIAICSCDSTPIAANGSVSFYVYDVVERTLTKVSFTNNSNVAVYGTCMNDTNKINITRDGFAICKKAYEYGSPYHWEMFKISNGAWETELESEYNNLYSFSFSFGENSIVTGRNQPMLILLDDKIPKPINASGILGDANVYSTYSDGSAFVHKRTDGGNFENRLYKNPLYLATICNLDSPVTKTASMAMKVIYTLTQA